MNGNDLIERVKTEILKKEEVPTNRRIVAYIKNMPQHVLEAYVVKLK